MSTTDPNPNPNPPSASGWASRAPSSPTAPGGAPPVPPRNSASAVARIFTATMVPRLLAAGVAVALMGAAYWFFVVHKNAEDVAASLPAAGTCFSFSEASQETPPKVLPCTDPAAAYRSEGSSTAGTAAATKRCDSLGAYVTIQVTSLRRNNSQSGVVCAALNLRTGDCVSDASGNSAVVPCATASGDDVKVLSLQSVATAAEAQSDDKAMAVCGSAATSYLSDTAGRTIVCVGKP